MAGMFSQDNLEQIRAASEIVEVIGSYLPLKRAGGNFVALCPFHREKTPSFNVNPHRQTFHCFGCHKGGDVFTFVKEFENLDFPEAVRRLAERAHIPLELDKNPGQQQARHLKDKLLEIHEQITRRWQSTLANEAGGQLARDYLAKRGVSAEAIKLFRLGAAPEAWDDTVNWARSKGYELNLVEQAGLILRKEGSDRYYDRFRGRLMFPICDDQGRVVGFSGRVLVGRREDRQIRQLARNPDLHQEQGLLRSRQVQAGAAGGRTAPLFAKGSSTSSRVSWPGSRTSSRRKARPSPRTTPAFSSAYVNEVVLCFDSDDAGQNAAVRSLDHLLASGLAVRVAAVPAPHDPDSFIKASGGPAFKELIEKARRVL